MTLASGPAHDLLSPLGLLLLINMMRSLIVSGAFMHFGTCCQSFEWICRATSQRSVSSPLGNTDRGFVQCGNGWASRVSLLSLWLLSFLDPGFMQEQPASSLLKEHPRMKQLINTMGEHFVLVRTWVLAFGGQHPKLVVVWGNGLWVH